MFDKLFLRESTIQSKDKLPGALGTGRIGSPVGALLPEESDGGGAATSAKGGRDGWALPDLWDSGEWVDVWLNPFEVSGNGDNKSNPKVNN